MSQSQPGFDPVGGAVASLFVDPTSSNAMVLAAQHVTMPIIAGVPLTDDEVETGGGARVVYMIIDGSPSMIVVAEALRNGFNNDYEPAVRAAREDDVAALRVGGCVFSSGSPTPIWRGTGSNAGAYFHPFDELPELTVAEYDPNRGQLTALHRAILEGSAVAFRYAAELQQATGIQPDVDIIILTDGANNTAPLDPAEVRQMIMGRRTSRVRYLFFYFQTDLGLADPRRYATDELGISPELVESFLANPGETPEQLASRMRRLMAVMSRVSASKGMSAVRAVQAAGLDDEEFV